MAADVCLLYRHTWRQSMFRCCWSPCPQLTHCTPGFLFVKNSGCSTRARLPHQECAPALLRGIVDPKPALMAGHTEHSTTSVALAMRTMAGLPCVLLIRDKGQCRLQARLLPQRRPLSLCLSLYAYC